VEGSPRKNAFSLGDFSLALAYRQRNFPLSAQVRLSDKISEMTERSGGFFGVTSKWQVRRRGKLAQKNEL